MFDSYTVFGTEVVAVTAAGGAASSTAVIETNSLRIVSDVIIHILLDGVATVADFRLPAGKEVIFSVPDGKTLSFIKATGEVDGSVWVSKVKAT